MNVSQADPWTAITPYADLDAAGLEYFREILDTTIGVTR